MSYYAYTYDIILGNCCQGFIAAQIYIVINVDKKFKIT